MVDSAAVLDIRRRLRRTWTPFFSRFGNLLPVQVAAIPAILDGHNVAIVSPTASGKTEAVVAPVAETMLRVGLGGIGTIYVSPTRALVNDTEVRCSEPLGEVGIACVVRTGDRPELTSRKAANFVITTPESLDSILCRKPEILQSLRTIILDELHLLDNSYRGDQLRVLLARLRDAIPQSEELKGHILSATLADPQGVADRYLADCMVVSQAGQREIVYSAVPTLRDAIEIARSDGLKKLIAFANSRAKVEETAAQLAQLYPANRIVVHHGSLSKVRRLEAETFMRESRIGICVATMTLEIGIDIGDIDAVLLIDPPLSVSSLLQRVGRGNRRSRIARAIAIFSSDQEERAYERLVHLARQGALGEDPYVPDLSVVVQQVFSLLFQNPQGMTEQKLWHYFPGFCSHEDFGAILLSLRTNGFLQQRGTTLYASTEIMDMGERGRLHSNIPDSFARQVIDESSGRAVGSVSDVVDNDFSLGGRNWRVARQRGSTIYVQPTGDVSAAPNFRTHKTFGAFHKYLPESIKRRTGPAT